MSRVTGVLVSFLRGFEQLSSRIEYNNKIMKEVSNKLEELKTIKESQTSNTSLRPFDPFNFILSGAKESTKNNKT